MISFFANLFGYLLNFLYEQVGNFGFAIILFSVLVKLIMLPISIKQQKTLKKTQKINSEMKQIQFKYKNDPEKQNQEIMSLYKREKISPFSGCFSAIIQIVLLFSVFYLVKSPLTYMRKVNPDVINKLEEIVQQEGNASNYKEIAVINYINKTKSAISVSEKGENENQNVENENEQSEQSDFNLNDHIDEAYMNMNFIGIDLSKVPTEDLNDYKVLIIPILYVISSFISIRMTSPNQGNNKKKDEKLLGDGQEIKKDEIDPMADMNKNMTWFMPIMSISIAIIAPLGLALYWLINNILIIVEKIILNKIIKDDDKEEAKSNAE